jgi:CheY-like chemotaxis protein
MQILLVDDRADSATVIASWLHEFFGPASVEWAPSAEEALAAIDRSGPDLVLAAHRPASINAIHLAGVVKNQPGPPAVVVIVMNSALELEAQCAEAGADFCVEKRHLQARLLAFLQARFPQVWADGVMSRQRSAWLGPATPEPRFT